MFIQSHISLPGQEKQAFSHAKQLWLVLAETIPSLPMFRELERTVSRLTGAEREGSRVFLLIVNIRIQNHNSTLTHEIAKVKSPKLIFSHSKPQCVRVGRICCPQVVGED